MVILPQIPELQAAVPKLSGQLLHTRLRLDKGGFITLQPVTHTHGLTGLMCNMNFMAIHTFNAQYEMEKLGIIE